MSLITTSNKTAGHVAQGSHLKVDQSSAVLVVDQDPDAREILRRFLSKQCALIEFTDSVESGKLLRERYQFNLIILNIELPGQSGIDWLRELRDQGSTISVILLTDNPDLDIAISALRTGACDFMVKPLQMERLSSAVNECLARQQQGLQRPKIISSPAKLEAESSIVGQSLAIRQTRKLIERIAQKSTTVLIEGETGTGKELVAREIHNLSDRTGKFVPLNCGSVPMELLESEMYGHTKGAYTGAHEAREGLFVHANGGSLFLDEIDEMVLPIQTRLLRVIEDRVVRPVGADQEILVDTRLIAASNQRLIEQVTQGKFREDLYYRLNVVVIIVPPLRERLDDVPMLATYFAKKFVAEHNIGQLTFTYDDLERLKEYSWPGNVRELRNVIERSLLLGLPLRECVATKSEKLKEHSPSTSVDALPLDWSLAEVEKFHLLNVLESVNGNKSEAARRLGVSRKTMERKLKEWNYVSGD